jgi:hypothetical protein
MVMKSFKQFIKEQEELEENKLAKTMLGLAIIGGLQAGAMRHDPVPNISQTSKTVEKSGDETRTSELIRTGAMKAGENARHIHRGFFDTKDREVVDTLVRDVPSKSQFKVTKTGPDGTAVASRTMIGNRTVNRTGSIDNTNLKIPTDDVTVSGKKDSFKNIVWKKK